MSIIIDYGCQVADNFINREEGDTAKDIFIKNIDCFDLLINGLVGGLTAGIGPAASEASRFSKLILNNLDKILLVSGSSLTFFLILNRVNFPLMISKKLVKSLLWIYL